MTKSTDLKFFDIANKLIFNGDWDYAFEDLDGSLTGKENQVLFFNNNYTKINPACTNLISVKNGISCKISDWIRFSFSLLSNISFININNRFGQTVISKLKEKDECSYDFMTILEAGQEYELQFEEEITLSTNISYSGIFYSVKRGQYFIIKHKMFQKPDWIDFGNQYLSSSESSNVLSSNNKPGSWFWENTTQTIYFLISNVNSEHMIDIPFFLQAYKCSFGGCFKPASNSIFSCIINENIITHENEYFNTTVSIINNKDFDNQSNIMEVKLIFDMKAFSLNFVAGLNSFTQAVSRSKENKDM